MKRGKKKKCEQKFPPIPERFSLAVGPPASPLTKMVVPFVPSVVSSWHLPDEKSLSSYAHQLFLPNNEPRPLRKDPPVRPPTPRSVTLNSDRNVLNVCGSRIVCLENDMQVRKEDSFVRESADS